MSDLDGRVGALETEVKWLKQIAGDVAASNQKLEEILTGNGKRGVVAKVDILWSSYVWVAGLAGTCLGSVITIVASKLLA